MDNAIQTAPADGTNADGRTTPQPMSAKGALPSVFLMVNSLETGGSERQFVALSQSLDRSAYSVHLACLLKKGAFLEGLGPLSTFGLGGSLYSLQSLRSRIQLVRHLRGNKIAVAQAFDFYANLILIPVARLAGVPVVLGSQRQIGDLLTWAQFRAQLLAFHWCDKVVCNSQAAAEHLRLHGMPADKLAIIRNGIPPSAFAGASPCLPPVPGLRRVGMIARMNHRAKNHMAFLRAAARVVSRFPAVEFVLAGDGPFRGEVEQEARDLGLGEHVRFLGDRRDIPAVLASLDVTVLPSSSESLSNSIIESMAAGVPVVASRVGGNVELISGERGVLVTADNDPELAAAIDSLLRDDALRGRLGQDAKAFAQANFTIDRMRRDHEELYANLLQRKGWQAKAFH